MAYYNIIFVLFLSFFCSGYCNTFFYFAYGSNLVEKRLKISCPSAKYYGVANLQGYRLDFNQYSKRWNGAVSTIVEDPEEHVYGAVWIIDEKDMPNIDQQEGVSDGFYYAKNVSVVSEDGKMIIARTYEETALPPKRKPFEDLPYERRPSSTYLQVIIFGGYESRLPSDYINFLVSFPSNGLLAPDAIRRELGYPFGPKQQ